MASARDIADERLARGDITAEEHSELLRRLDAAGRHPAPGRSSIARSILKYGVRIGGGILLLGAVLVFYGWNMSKDIELGNVAAVGNYVTLRVANSGGREGDALVWLEQNDVRMCEHVVRLTARRSYTVRLRCPTLRNGHFRIRTQWASYDPGMTAIATRIAAQGAN